MRKKKINIITMRNSVRIKLPPIPYIHIFFFFLTVLFFFWGDDHMIKYSIHEVNYIFFFLFSSFVISNQDFNLVVFHWASDMYYYNSNHHFVRCLCYSFFSTFFFPYSQASSCHEWLISFFIYCPIASFEFLFSYN